MEGKVRVGRLKNGRDTGKDEVTGEMIKGGDDRMVNLILRLCNMAFERGVVPEDWVSPVIVPLHKGNGERAKLSNYRGISLLSLAGKIYAGILVDRVRNVTEGLINDEQRGVQCRERVWSVLLAWRRHMIRSIGRHYGKY